MRSSMRGTLYKFIDKDILFVKKALNRFKPLLLDILQKKSYQPFFINLSYFFWRILRLPSLKHAVKEQDLISILSQLEKIVPDYRYQFSFGQIEGEFWNYKVRAHHAFQVRLTNKAIKSLFNEHKNKQITVVDIGDSSGNHICYFKELNKKYNIRSLSVNLDPIAVRKIKEKGLEAIHSKAEELHKYNIHPDIFVSFQTLEHLNSPIYFLKSLADNSSCKYFVITIPYRRISRVGLFHIRNNLKDAVYAETTHILELNPDDWKLIFQHAGWKVTHEEIYLQYPLKHPFRLLKNSWARIDYEGFYGVILERDSTWSSKYLDW